MSMDKVYRIYRIDHKIEGELQAVYIGYTSQTLKSRLNNHLRDKNCKFGQYWQLYTSGEHLSHRDELSIYELASTDIKADAIKIEEEQTRITKKIYGDKCLNDRVGNKLSGETKKKMSEARKGEKRSEETRAKISETLKGSRHPMFGKKRSEETKKKISEAQKGSKNHAAKPCEYDGRIFGSYTEAYEYARECGYTKSFRTFKNMIKKGGL